jgi:hypothetical protein
VIDGLRTKIVEGDRFRAFGWGHETIKPVACRKLAKIAGIAIIEQVAGPSRQGLRPTSSYLTI